jgi:aryl-alcohol dehydrogenase-like predicted oxidoreductase
MRAELCGQTAEDSFLNGLELSKMTAERRQFGHHHVLVSKLGLGCAKLSPFSGSLKFASIERVINRALDRGITFFDTADSYGAGWSERWLGRALNAHRGDVFIATKCGHPATVTGKIMSRLASVRGAPRSAAIHPDYLFSPAYIEYALGKSLQRLGTDYVDVYLLHSPPSYVLRAGLWLNTMHRLRKTGLIRFFGISARTAEDAASAIRDYGVDCVEIELNPSTAQSMELVFAIARHHGAAIIARQVFGSGALLNAVLTRLDHISKGHTLGEVAAALLEFNFAIPDVSVTIAGMSTAEHVDANTSTASLTADFIWQVVELARALCPSACNLSQTTLSG